MHFNIYSLKGWKHGQIRFAATAAKPYCKYENILIIILLYTTFYIVSENLIIRNHFWMLSFDDILQLRSMYLLSIKYKFKAQNL